MHIKPTLQVHEVVFFVVVKIRKGMKSLNRVNMVVVGENFPPKRINYMQQVYLVVLFCRTLKQVSNSKPPPSFGFYPKKQKLYYYIISSIKPWPKMGQGELARHERGNKIAGNERRWYKKTGEPARIRFSL